MTTSQLARKLKIIHRRKFVASELNQYAIILGKKLVIGLNGNNFYLWEESDIEKIKPLID